MEDDISCNFGVSVDGGERERERERGRKAMRALLVQLQVMYY
jgi:hypothetical protein